VFFWGRFFSGIPRTLGKKLLLFVERPKKKSLLGYPAHPTQLLSAATPPSSLGGRLGRFFVRGGFAEVLGCRVRHVVFTLRPLGAYLFGAPAPASSGGVSSFPPRRFCFTLFFLKL